MLIYKAMNVFPSAIREVVLDEYAADVAGPMRIRKEFAAQVRFDDPLPLELELARPSSDAEALRRRIEESVRERLRVRVAVELLDRGAIPIGEYKNALTYVAEGQGQPPLKPTTHPQALSAGTGKARADARAGPFGPCTAISAGTRSARCDG